MPSPRAAAAEHNLFKASSNTCSGDPGVSPVRPYRIRSHQPAVAVCAPLFWFSWSLPWACLRLLLTDCCPAEPVCIRRPSVPIRPAGSAVARDGRNPGPWFYGCGRGRRIACGRQPPSSSASNISHAVRTVRTRASVVAATIRFMRARALNCHLVCSRSRPATAILVLVAATVATALLVRKWASESGHAASDPPGGGLWAISKGQGRNVTCRAHEWHVRIYDDFHFAEQVDSQCYDYNPLDPCGAVPDITDCWCPGSLTSCDHFSATFATSMDISADQMQVFLVNANDEAHIFIDGRATFSALCSGLLSCEDRVFVRNLQRGRHDLHARFMNHAGGAHMFLRWQAIELHIIEFHSRPALQQGQLLGGGTADAFAFQAREGMTYHFSLQVGEMVSVRMLLFDESWIEVSMAIMDGEQIAGHLIWACTIPGTYRVLVIPGPRAPVNAVDFLLSVGSATSVCADEPYILAGPGGVLDYSTVSQPTSCTWAIRCPEGFAASITLPHPTSALAAYAGETATVASQLAYTSGNTSSGFVLRSSNNKMLLQFTAVVAQQFVATYRCIEEQYVRVEVGSDSVQGVINSAGDRGAFEFAATGGEMYGIQIQRESLPRCVLQLMHFDGETVLVMLDDRGERQGSIEWLCPADGQYSFSVTAYSDDHTGSFRVLVLALPDPCAQAMELTSSTGMLAYSNRFAHPPTECVWNLHCEDSEMATIYFTAFHTSRRGVLQVYDGQNTHSEPIASLSGPLGASGAGAFDTEQSSMHLVYSSESLTVEQFELEYRCNSPVFQIEDCVPGQFLVSYFANPQFQGDSAQAVCSEPVIDFNWGQRGVDMLTGQVDNFSIRWSGSLDFEPANYVFFSRSDDGSRVLVDREVVLDHLQDCCATWHSEGIGLVAGHHDIVYEFVEYGAEAYCTLTWVRASRSVDEGCADDVCKNGGRCMEVQVPETSYPSVMTAYTIEVTQNFSAAVLDHSLPTRKILEAYVTSAYASVMDVPIADVIVMSIRSDPELVQESGWVHHPGGVPITIQFSVLCTPDCPPLLASMPTTMMALPAHNSASCDCARGFTGSRCGVQSCLGQSCELEMRDLEGDGWNGNTLEIRTHDGSVVVRGVTLGGGPVATTQVCLPVATCMHVTVDGGANREEVSWTLYDSARNSLISGGAPFRGQFGC